MTQTLGNLQQAILLAGTGRSGTTWLGKLLDSSPDLLYKHEPDHQRNFPWFQGLDSRIAPEEDDPEVVARYCRAWEESFWHYSSFLHKRPDFPKNFFRSGTWGLLTRSSRVYQKVSRGKTPILRIPRWMFRGDPSSVPLVVKSVVSNLRLAWIHRHFPNVKTVLIMRHPGGYLHSMIEAHEKHDWPKYGTMERLEHTVLPMPRPELERYEQPFREGTDFEREVIYWIVANATPLLELESSGRILPVAYEDLCERTMGVMEEIFAFLNLPMSDKTREFVTASTTVQRDGFYGVYKDPVQAAHKWRKGLDEEQTATIERYLSESVLARYWQSTPERIGS